MCSGRDLSAGLGHHRPVAEDSDQLQAVRVLEAVAELLQCGVVTHAAAAEGVVVGAGAG